MDSNNSNNTNDSNNSTSSVGEDQTLFTEEDLINLDNVLRISPRAEDTSTNNGDEPQTRDSNANMDSDSEPPVFFPISPPSSSSSSIEVINSPLEALLADLVAPNPHTSDSLVDDILRAFPTLEPVQPNQLLDLLFRNSNTVRDPMFLPWQDVGPNEIWPENSSFQWLRDLTSGPIPLPDSGSVLEPIPELDVQASTVPTIIAFAIIILIIISRINPPLPNEP